MWFHSAYQPKSVYGAASLPSGGIYTRAESHENRIGQPSSSIPKSCTVQQSFDAMKLLLLFVGIGLSQIIPFDQTLPILTSPVLQAKAGDELQYQ